jgi:hypothetical protein
MHRALEIGLRVTLALWPFVEQPRRIVPGMGLAETR